MSLDILKNTHDLRLPSWGPYTKRYMGISHLPSIKDGLRFDLSVCPGRYRRNVMLPNVRWESGYHPWEAAPDLRYYSLRYELEWKDRVYADVSFSSMGEDARLVRCRYVNRSETGQNLTLHYMASLHFPAARPNSNTPIRPATVSLPEQGLWIDACEYNEWIPGVPGPRNNFASDGMLRAEIRADGFVGGSGIAMPWRTPGDKACWEFRLHETMDSALLLMRCRNTSDAPSDVRLRGIADTELHISQAPELAMFRIPIGRLNLGTARLEIQSLKGTGLQIDGFAVVPQSAEDEVRFNVIEWNPVPTRIPGPAPASLLLEYDHATPCYGIAWSFPRFEIRQYCGSNLDTLMLQSAHNHVQDTFRGEGSEHYTNIYLRPVMLPPGAEFILDGMVCAGSRAEVQAQIKDWEARPETRDSIYTKARAGRCMATPPAGDASHCFAQERMAATTLTNVVYPIYARRGYIRHYTPGRNWDSLYTWDCGVIGLGLLELDPERAVDILNAYMTEPGDPHASFIHHGSIVPTQFFAFHDLWNRTQRLDLLEFFYPRLRQYHRFLSGRAPSSGTASFVSGLLTTWDYFYNSGGWDDYPAQVHVHRCKLTSRTAPVITSAITIRTARILRTAARALGREDDATEYSSDIERLSDAIQAFAWDDEAGYFSYVLHDEEGRADGPLRHETGVNYNRGLDGAYPLVAGICSREQERRLMEALQCPTRHWTQAGLSTVDQTAPYYRNDGYWNGAVWMPHQWIFWKSMLDLGYRDFAWHIAERALDVWSREVDASYHCFEHFVVESGRGAGWHQFSGLSTPVLSWYAAYFTPGRLTGGFDVQIEKTEIRADKTELIAWMVTDGEAGRSLSVVICLSPEGLYQAYWNENAVTAHPIRPGTVAVDLPCQSRGKLTVRKQGQHDAPSGNAHNEQG